MPLLHTLNPSFDGHSVLLLVVFTLIQTSCLRSDILAEFAILIKVLHHPLSCLIYFPHYSCLQLQLHHIWGSSE